jgi:predicted nucleic acid-binding protein
VITAVDTNVLLDVFGADPTHGRRSRAALRRCAAEGRLVACEVVWIEACVRFPTPADGHRRLDDLGIAFDPVDRATAAAATAAWAEYRRAGGRRERVVADFTRDRGFYGGRFTGLVVLDPSVGPDARTA